MIIADVQALTTFSTSLNIILVIATVALGALNIRNKYEKDKDSETLNTLKESNSAFATRREADKIIIEARDAEIRVLNSKAEVLEKHVTQAPQINELTIQLATQHKEILVQFSRMTRELGNVAKAISRDANAHK